MRKTILDLSDAQDVLESVLKHWKNSNQSLARKDIVLKGGYTAEAFEKAIIEFEQMGHGIDQVVEQRDKASETLILYKENMRDTMKRIAFLIRGSYPESSYTRGLPALPDTRSNEAKFMAPVDKTYLVWKQINLYQTLTMPEGTTLEAFGKGIQVLRQAFKARDRAFLQERQLRAARRAQHQALINRAVQYRSMVMGTFGEDSVLALTLPYLWPVQDRSKKPNKLEVVTNEAEARLA